MRRPLNAWHRHVENWQFAFIQENIMPLGHTAWQGYLTQGRGLVTRKVSIIEAASSTVSGDVMSENALYIPASEVAIYLKRYGLKADVTNRLTTRVQTYCPSREILVFMERRGEISISLLTNLAIAPPDCYRQVCNRWEEFYLEPRSAGRSS
ncbi:MAG: hypothetical protein DCF15_06785 [Phormidesmis priestleyi]|uniref:Uncharacterized protein n=1 Tax=Phormidesmis priestleyi TaxID=268141 RepID=A0A2W4XJL0_9CYAN|nr:MAG: hypothetical protein DCF15_06785 [Phormidesmis priestleyi]